MAAAPTPTGMVGVLLLAFALAGCAAGATAMAKRHLDVQTRMTDTVFLDPVAPDARTIYVDIRNTSDRPDLDIAPQVRDAVAA
ncbi:MAG: complement resistance protein TraT, partial [Hypericibacter sp.]